MLAQHPSIAVPPAEVLTPNQEFPALLHLFRTAIDDTPINSSKYIIDRSEFDFVMDAYVSSLDNNKEYLAIKMPYYPLNCMEFFVDYFGRENIVLIYLTRPIEKITASYVRRGEDKYFFSHAQELVRQVKKLSLQRRKEYLARAPKDPRSYFIELAAWCDRMRDAWDRDHPNLQFINVDIEKFATSLEYLNRFLEKLGLSTEHAHEMRQVVDARRLTDGSYERSVSLLWKGGAIARALMPPIFRSLAGKFLRR